MNIEILSKIKTISIFFISSIILVIITFIMYQTLDINGNNLKDEAHTLTKKLITLNKKTKKSIEKVNKSIDFFNKNNFIFLNIKNQFDLIQFSKLFNNSLTNLYPNIKIVTKNNLEKTKVNLYKYPFVITFKYINPYYFNKIINYFNNNYFYELTNLTYDSKNQKFIFKGNLFSKNKIKLNFKKKR